VSPEGASPRIADSVLLGALSLALSIAALTIAFLVRGDTLRGNTIVGVAFTWMCASPVIALLNLVFVARDRQAGRTAAATVGAVLSGLSVLVALVPFALAD
jgi:hypothetical protein